MQKHEFSLPVEIVLYLSGCDVSNIKDPPGVGCEID